MKVTNMHLNGVHHEVSTPEQLINTFEVEGYPGFSGVSRLSSKRFLMARRSLPRLRYINQ
ncbi:hypothetical protein ACJROX_19620 [Pseudalkalibacillus sp. A8]|uniref:hypothetical protein n=1 Tax=Pseudalkalibacillus sp. A8 TaxID=3382641 RepID=UPI0038B57640